MIRSIEKRIARIAERAIWRPKLDETFLIPNGGRVRLRLQRLLDLALLRRRRATSCGPGSSCSSSPPLTVAPRPWRTASPWPIAFRPGRARRRATSARRLERDLRAALEVDAEVEPADAERDDADQDHDARDREPEVPPAHEVDLQPLRVLRRRCAPMKRGFSNQRKPASRPSIARVAATAVSSEITVPISSISAKPLTLRGRDREQDERRDAGHDVRVDDRAEALRVARRDGGAHGFAGAHLLLDAFEDDDVRVRRDADREDHARRSPAASASR